VRPDVAREVFMALSYLSRMPTFQQIAMRRKSLRLLPALGSALVLVAHGAEDPAAEIRAKVKAGALPPAFPKR
jgi:hypothetical protein